MMNYTIEDICKITNKLTYDRFERERNETNYELAELIAYFSGKNHLYYEDDDKLGLRKEFAKNLPVLLDMFNKYCKIQKEYNDISQHGSPDYVETGRYVIYGKVPKVLAQIINKEYKKNQKEDYQYFKSRREKAQKEQELKNETTKNFYDKLMS